MAYYFDILTGGKQDFESGPYSTITECRKKLIQTYDAKYKKKYPTAALNIASDKNGIEGSVDEDKGRYIWVSDRFYWNPRHPRRYINKDGTLGKYV